MNIDGLSSREHDTTDDYEHSHEDARQQSSATKPSRAAPTTVAPDTDASSRQQSSATKPSRAAPTTVAPDTDASSRQQSSATKPSRAAPASATIGMMFIAAALASLTNRFWVDVDWVLTFGVIICAAGIMMIASVAARG